MKSRKSVYHNILLELVSRLSLDEQARLVSEIRDRTEGFGMWKHRHDLKDPEDHVLRLRELGSKHPDGSPKDPQEFLGEIV